MKKLIIIFIVFGVILSAPLNKNILASECQNIEGQIQLWNGWPPWIRIESKDKKNVFGIETNEEVTKSDFIPRDLMDEIVRHTPLEGTFCIKLTGRQTTVPYDDRVIDYVKVISYEFSK